jgi:hypothetical protein
MTDQPSYEELAAPRPNRLAHLLAILLALLVATVLVVHLIDSGSSKNNASPVVPTNTVPTAVHSVPYTPPPVQPVIVPPFQPAPPCPRTNDGQVACTTYPGLPPSTARALRERFPRIVVERAVTQMLRAGGPEARPGMWSREIRARIGAVRMRIAVRRAESVDRGTTGLRQGNLVQVIRLFRNQYLIQVELRGPVDPESLTSTIAWLLNDPRLVRPVVAIRGTMMR